MPGGKGRAVELKKGQYFKITNTYGEQVGEFVSARFVNIDCAHACVFDAAGSVHRLESRLMSQTLQLLLVETEQQTWYYACICAAKQHHVSIQDIS